MKKISILCLCLLLVLSASFALADDAWQKGDVRITSFGDNPSDDGDASLGAGFHRVTVGFRHPDSAYTLQELSALEDTLALYDSDGNSYEMLGWTGLAVNLTANSFTFAERQGEPKASFSVADGVAAEDLTLYFGPKDDPDTLFFVLADLAANPTAAPEE